MDEPTPKRFKPWTCKFRAELRAVVFAAMLPDVGAMKEIVVERLFRLFLLALAAAGPGHELAFGEAARTSAAEVFKYEEPKSLSAAIYARGTKQLVFKFKRVAEHSGNTLRVQRDFTYPDGKLAARERVSYEGDLLVSYELEELQIGASGRAAIRHHPDNPSQGNIDFVYTREPDGRPKSHTEGLRENILVADMVGQFLASHWDTLERREKVKCRYIVVPRSETVGFTFAKDGDATRAGVPVIVVRMEASSALVAPLVDPLFFTIEKSPPHRVLEYTGRTTPKIQVKGKWKDLDALTVFDWESAR